MIEAYLDILRMQMLDKLNEFLVKARIVNGDRKGNEYKIRPRV
jgi:hypothetical protein